MSEAINAVIDKIESFTDRIAREVGLLRLLLLGHSHFDAMVVFDAERCAYTCLWSGGQNRVDIPAHLTEDEQIQLLTVALKTSC